MGKKKIAVLTQDLSVGSNGVLTVAKFLYDIINTSDDFSAKMISLATSARDANSVRLLQPKTWINGVKITSQNLEGIPFQHIGANLTEIEFCRYRPRRVLDEILHEFDLVQIVAGTPVWTLAAMRFRGKIALQVATLTKVERETVLQRTPQPKRFWLQAMSKINENLEEKAFHRADAILVENDWLKNRLQKTFPEKTIFAPPGVNTDFFRPKDYQENGYLLAVGRFADVRKNVRLLFQAYKKILDKFKNVPRLILAGQTAPSAEDLAVAKELKIHDKIEIFINISREKLRELYQDSSVFVSSSNEEGFGLAIAEAMACGLPVVSTRCGGPEILVADGESGFLVPTGDAESLTRRLTDLLENAEMRRQFGAAGRLRIEEKFSIEVTGQVYLETYYKLLKG